MNNNAVQTKQAGNKNDAEKLRLDLIEPEFIEAVGEVLTFGAKKYSPNDWQKLDDPVNRYYAATLRHLMAWRKGEQNDDESGLSHLSHIATNIMFLLHFERGEK